MDDYDKLRERHKELRSQNAQLRKRLRLVEEELERIKEILGEGPQEAAPSSYVHTNTEVDVCTKCGDKTIALKKGSALLIVCTGCGKRHTKKG